jgi:hypothetical protein
MREKVRVAKSKVVKKENIGRGCQVDEETSSFDHVSIVNGALFNMV